MDWIITFGGDGFTIQQLNRLHGPKPIKLFTQYACRLKLFIFGYARDGVFHKKLFEL